MFSPANAPRFSLTIDGFAHDFKVRAFTGEEAISKPYFFNVECVSERPDLDLQCLFDVPAFLAFDTWGNGIHGRIYHIARGPDAQGLTHYNLALVPHLSYLRHRINKRIYQQFSVPAIVALVLEEHGILGDAYRFELGASYPERDCCTQYDETDLHFIQRLCEEEGIHFHFQHSAQGHVLVFGDQQAVFPAIGPTTAFAPGHDGLATLLPVGHGTPTSLRARESRQVEGQGTQSGLLSGHVLETSGQGSDLWLLTQVIHEGKQPQVAGESVANGYTDNQDQLRQGYRNRFTALALDLCYRPPLAHEKPLAPCNQTALVIALEDQANSRGQRFERVKVKFPWDREGRFDDKSSCWLAGTANWRCDVTPLRPGVEVKVAFLENDPDQPLISGCLCCG
ncbi:contractile injection system protein, VgrG/Pvc8 family [Pseudomonas protegens]|uniref:contractile injection system protein, VgrG/Pvc8 family n=1 Tax=Pseudomonas protegens TaxID=380021 RepID=UPI004029BFFD